MNLPDKAGLDRDIQAAMMGLLAWPELMNRWVPRIPLADRYSFLRYVSERIHDVLVRWSPGENGKVGWGTHPGS